MFACTAAVKHELSDLDQEISDRERIDRIRHLEELKSVLAAAQARETAAFVASHQAAQARRGVPADRVGRCVAAQIGLARRISPFQAARYVSQVQVLTADLPETFAKLAAGAVSEWHALTVARETSWLGRDNRAAVDSEIARELGTVGTRRLVDTVHKTAYRLDPHGYLDRLKIAESERHVSVWPAAEAMVRLSAVVPMIQGISCYATLTKHAQAMAGVGTETRTRSQIMADTLIERLTGQTQATAVPIQVNLIMTDQTLLNHGDGRDHPATVIGGGVIPAELARRTLTTDAKVLLRRLYFDPAGRLAAMESVSRCFTTAQRSFLTLRDQTCRTPFCDAPIRHADHVIPAEHGGPTTITNGQGLCETCNYTKTSDGWTQQPDGDTIETTTPTGHTYRSRAPATLVA